MLKFLRIRMPCTYKIITSLVIMRSSATLISYTAKISNSISKTFVTDIFYVTAL